MVLVYTNFSDQFYIYTKLDNRDILYIEEEKCREKVCDIWLVPDYDR